MNWSSVGRSIKSKSKETLKKSATKVGSTSKEIVKKSAHRVGKKLIGQKDPAQQLECLKRCLECITSKKTELYHKCPNCNALQNHDETAQTGNEFENFLQRVNSSDILCYNDGKNSLIFCPSDPDLKNKSNSKPWLPGPEEAQVQILESKRHSELKTAPGSDEWQARDHSRSPSLDPLRTPPEVERKRTTESIRSGNRNSPLVSPVASPEPSSKRSLEIQWGESRQETRKRSSENSPKTSTKRTIERSAEADWRDEKTQERYDSTKPSRSNSPRGERYPAGASRSKQKYTPGTFDDDTRSSARERSSPSQKQYEEEEIESAETSIDSQNRKTSSLDSIEDEQSRVQYRKSSLKRRSDQQTDKSQRNSYGERNNRSSHKLQSNERSRASRSHGSSASFYPEERDLDRGTVDDFGQEQGYSRHSSKNKSRKATSGHKRVSQYDTYIHKESSGNQKSRVSSPSGNVTFSPEVFIDSGRNESQIRRTDSRSTSIEPRQNNHRRSGAHSQSFSGGYLETLPEDPDIQYYDDPHNYTEEPLHQESSQRSPSHPGIPAESSLSRPVVEQSRTKPKSALRTSTKTPSPRPNLREHSVSHNSSIDHVNPHLPSAAGFQPSRTQPPHVPTSVERNDSLHGHSSNCNVCCDSGQKNVCCRNGGSIPCCPCKGCCNGNIICCQNNHSEGIYRSDNKESSTPTPTPTQTQTQTQSNHYHHHLHHLFHSSPKDMGMSTCVACNDPDYFGSGQRIYEKSFPMCNYHRLQCQRQKMMLSNPAEYGHFLKDGAAYSQSPKAHKFRAAISLPRFDLERNKIINCMVPDDLNDLRLRSNLSCHGLNSMLLPMHPVDPHMLSLLYKNKQKYEDLRRTPPSFLDESAYLVPGISSLPPPTPVESSPATPVESSPATPAESSPPPQPEKRKCTFPVTLDYRNQRVKPPKSEGAKSKSPEPSLASNKELELRLEAEARAPTPASSSTPAPSPAPISRSSISSDPFERDNSQLLEILRKSRSSTDANLLERVVRKLPQNPSMEPSAFRFNQSARGSELTGYEAFLLANPEIQPPSACELDARKGIEERMAEARSSFYKYLSPDSNINCRLRATEGRMYPKDYPALNNSIRRPENQLVICDCTAIDPEAFGIRVSADNIPASYFNMGGGLPYQRCSHVSADAQFSMLPATNYSLANICASPVIDPSMYVPQYSPMCLTDNTPLSETELNNERWAREKEDWKEM